jgi:uncharacterized protein (TIGR03435 family)
VEAVDFGATIIPRAVNEEVQMKHPVASVLAALAAVALIHTMQGDSLEAQDAKFEVVSIKRSNLPPDFALRPPSAGTYRSSATVQLLLILAHPQVTSPENILGLPTWATSDRYDVIAKGKVGATREEEAQMWQQMLADRFGLKASIETRPRPSYDLLMARSDRKLGQMLKPSTLECSKPGPQLPDTATNQAAIDRALMARCGISNFRGALSSGGAEIKMLAQALRGPSGRPVVDKTGLSGRFAFTLSFTQQLGNSDIDNTLPDLFTALREQLGLKLEPGTTPMPVINVQQIRRPSEN